MNKLRILLLSSLICTSVLVQKKTRQCRTGYKQILCQTSDGQAINGAKRSGFCWKEKKKISEKRKAKICKRNKKRKKAKKITMNTK